MTADELAAIRERAADDSDWLVRPRSWGALADRAVRDRRALLAEVDRLREAIKDVHYYLALPEPRDVDRAIAILSAALGDRATGRAGEGER